MSPESTPRLGIVVIGRNEGARLERCLDSLAERVVSVVYVDSGSSDGSAEMARRRGVDVVELDPARPFTMARGRNEGFAHLAARLPALSRVQFVDGDCEVAAGWLDAAERLLDERADVGAVSGRRRERERERSVYNRIIDMEWDVPAGESAMVGGDVMMRSETFRAAGGYREDMIAGEDPEISVRIRGAGWKIHRLADEMTRHDAAMHRFGQWWIRSLRSGHAYAEGAHLHRDLPERPFARECRSGWLYGLALPVAALLASFLSAAALPLLLAFYLAQSARIAWRRRRSHGDAWGDAALWGVFCVLGKLPQMLGQARFAWSRWRGRRTELLEYKGS